MLSKLGYGGAMGKLVAVLQPSATIRRLRIRFLVVAHGGCIFYNG